MNRTTHNLPTLLRLLATYRSRPLSTATTIPSLLTKLSTTKPLKDAVKFIRPLPEKPSIWTNRELLTHVSALTAGLHELNYTPSDQILTLLSPGSQEFSVLLLAAANLNLSVVALSPPPDPNQVSVDDISAALQKYRPRALFLGKEFAPVAAEHGDEDAIVATVNPLVNALLPGVALEDARGLNGLVPLTGRPFASSKYPFLQHVVQTSDTNVRGTITFKSLLVYSGETPPVQKSDAPLLVLAEDGVAVSAEKVLKAAKSLGKRIGLNADHTAKSGKLVVTPAVSEKSIVAVVSALMHEALWVCPGEADSNTVSQSENALVV